jgi:hypothetical protein
MQNDTLLSAEADDATNPANRDILEPLLQADSQGPIKASLAAVHARHQKFLAAHVALDAAAG